RRAAQELPRGGEGLGAQARRPQEVGDRGPHVVVVVDDDHGGVGPERLTTHTRRHYSLAAYVRKGVTAPNVLFRRAGVRPVLSQPLRKASRSALMVSASVVGIPWG